MDYRHSLGRDLNASLEDGPHERPVDHLHAFSRASRLGTLLWRLKHGYDPTSYKNAVLLLSKKAQLVHPIGRRLTELVIYEWLNPNCPVCIGAKEILVNDLKIVCAECNGLGLRKYEDKFRDQFLGTRFQPWAKQYGLIHAILGKQEIRVNVRMNIELETI